LIYLDNAATTWPKPDIVWQAMEKMIKEMGANPGRAGHRMALSAGRVIYEARESLAKLFKINDPLQIVFTLNATESINLALKGLLVTGDHVITTSMEHNAVVRPLKVLEEKGVEISVIQANNDGIINPLDVKEAIKENTKCIVMTHASNVFGAIQPIKEVGKIAKEKGIIFMVDAAQTAGVLPIDVEEMGIDLLAFPGHKSLYGPQGTGGLYIRPGIQLVPLKEGGTGSSSEEPFQPLIMPDRYESGTPNTIGIAGLGAGVEYILKEGLINIYEHEMELTKRLINGLEEIPDVIIYGPKDIEKIAPVVSFNFEDEDSSEIGFMLDRVYEIAVRTGLHCAPWAHKSLGTLQQGTVRLSLSYFNTKEDVDYVIKSLKEIGQQF
jgi:cysteine desulfurase / selenocysteine lyase